MTIARVVVAVVAVGWGVAAAAAADPIPPSRAWVKISSAELAARYDTLWAVSDVHGRLEELEQLLVGSRLAVRRGATVAWSAGQGRALLVVAGDLLDGGPDSVGVALMLERLQREAAAAGSRIVVLLGNHEAKFLAHPHSATAELMASAARHGAELGLPPRFPPRALAGTSFGEFLRGLPVAAFIGSWLFAHAGYVDAQEGEAGLRAWLAGLDATMAPRDRDSFRTLLDPHSVVAYHGWWRSDARRAEMSRRLHALGLNGVVFGHDPDALGAPWTMAMNRDGWMMKLDAGLRRGGRGMLLRCDIRDIVASGQLAMRRDGTPACRTATPGGTDSALPVR